MISLQQLQEFINMRPFRPFSLETIGGNYIIVQSPDHIKLPPPKHEVITVYGEDGIVHHFILGAIVTAQVYGPAPV
jgi:hypothetical protein